jgi:hypothetical protein
METTAHTQPEALKPAVVEPDPQEPTEAKKEKPLLAVEIMNGIVFSVVLILFGLVWGTVASVTYASW